MIRKTLNRSLIKLAGRCGYTLLRGNLRAELARVAMPRLPAALLENSRVLPNRNDVLKLLPKGGCAVEVGVAYGDFSEEIIRELRPDKFIAIDYFLLRPGHDLWGRKDLTESKLSHIEYYRRRFRDSIEAKRLEIHQGLSWDGLAELPDHSIDYLYLDAGHSYSDVSKDLAQLKRKVKQGAFIQFNDYTNFDSIQLSAYGVGRAVNEFMVKEDYEMLYLTFQPNGFNDVVIRKRDQR